MDFRFETNVREGIYLSIFLFGEFDLAAVWESLPGWGLSSRDGSGVVKTGPRGADLHGLNRPPGDPEAADRDRSKGETGRCSSRRWRVPRLISLFDLVGHEGEKVRLRRGLKPAGGDRRDRGTSNSTRGRP